jgi:hypothetical protein
MKNGLTCRDTKIHKKITTGIHLTHRVQLQPVKDTVWYAVRARISGPEFFNETIICESYVYGSYSGNSFQS